MNFLTLDRPPAVTRTATALAALLMAGAAAASEGNTSEGGPTWHFSGYGSLGVVHADTNEGDFVTSIMKTHGAGRTDRLSANVDSRLGAQVRVDLDDKWSAVLQVISEQGLDRTYRPRVEWANIKYQVTPDLSVRVGRIALPIYLAADYRKVGYAYSFVRLPAEVYNSIPITHSDGIDVNYRWQTGALKHTAQISYGRNQTPLIEDYTLDAVAMSGLAYTVERGPLSVRVSAVSSRLSSNIGAALFDGYRQFGAVGRALADKYAPVNKRANGVTVAAVYDPGNWYVMGEAGRMNGHSILLKTQAAFVSAGFRHGAFTPYGLFAWTRAAEPTAITGVPLAGLPRQAAAGAAYLNAYLNGYLGTTAQQSSLAAGVRWDFMSNVALKLEYSHLRPRYGSRGTLINDQPAARTGQHVNVASAVFDFVF